MAQTNKAEFYRDGRNWRWRIWSTNGLVIGASTESYINKADAVKNFSTVTGRQVADNTAAGDWTVLGLN